jgi:hypothetical protein
MFFDALWYCWKGNLVVVSLRIELIGQREILSLNLDCEGTDSIPCDSRDHEGKYIYLAIHSSSGLWCSRTNAEHKMVLQHS